MELTLHCDEGHSASATADSWHNLSEWAEEQAWELRPASVSDLTVEEGALTKISVYGKCPKHQES